MSFLRWCGVVWVLLVVAAGGQQQDMAREMLRSVSNGQVVRRGDGFELRREAVGQPMRIGLGKSLLLGVRRQKEQWWILPASETTTEIRANESVWVLPVEAKADGVSLWIKLGGHAATTRLREDGAEIEIDADNVTVVAAESRPHSDVFGHRFSITVGEDHALEEALAGFYWGTMLPLVVEKTMAAGFRYSDGYVLSTLKTSQYAGTYPAVDHEFQIAGRLAMGSPLDLDVVRRMIELQFKVMRDDPEGLFRAPCSVQPDGRREYHIRRNSKDNHENAAMFPLTGNIEVVGEAWHYYEMSRDVRWLRGNIANLEHAAGWTLAHTDEYGRVWSDVYYEDQVMKDGRETEAQAFAARSFDVLARMESLVGKAQAAKRYEAVAKKMVDALVRPLPMGYWDAANQRFVDWVDRSSRVHDHLHLVANTAPVTLGYASPAQGAAVKKLIAANDAEFERFPSFVAAHVEAYSQSEMGEAGPYDLSAAGRYWFWDAAYRASQSDGATLMHQLQMVAAEGVKSNYFMGERYDMDHVYYVDGKNAHGAEKYFEYPNVFTAVLIGDLLGVTKTADVDVSVAPRLPSYGEVEFATPGYEVSYGYSADGFALKNLARTRRSFAVDLSGMKEGKTMRLVGGRAAGKLWLAPGETVRWAVSH